MLVRCAIGYMSIFAVMLTGSHLHCFVPLSCSGWGGVHESGLQDVDFCACDLEMPPQADTLVCSAAQEV